MIKVNGLEFTYPKAKEMTLKGLNFELRKGEILGFLGPSGAGKSTTQKILIGILKNYIGQVKVFDKELNKLGSDFYERVGVSFEFPNLYSKFTALENLEFFSALYSVKTESPKKLLDMVGLLENKNMRVSEFSKGMKMRLNFCRAFLNNPDIIFLDEPTSGLDPVNAKKIKDIILEQKQKGKTIFLTTHNMNVAEDICDRVAFIVNGEIKLIDSPRQLKLDRGNKVVRVEYQEQGAMESKEFEIEGIGSNQQFAELLKVKKIETIHTQEATLEDIFIQVTGRSLL
ncbi:MAG: transporter ATP-binding protein [Clostridia bacterium]|jgi:fluoroquinolone transport system ATP-binding protein|nr:transporter ATP-binding protein [Clostridia bacterium]